VFGFEVPDGCEHRGIEWKGYRPGGEIALRQSKTGNLVVLPLTVDVPDGEGGRERIQLYLELEEELALVAAARQGATGLSWSRSAAARSTRSGACHPCTAQSAIRRVCPRR
jgi:hypothetical protein